MDPKRPLMLGIVGDSAAGKTTLARGVVRLLGSAGVTPLCLDDYHRYSRAERQARGITALDPQANDLDMMAEHLATLRGGGVISKPVYDHRNGTLRGPELVAATGLVIAYGMLTLTPPRLAELFDLTLYLEPAAEVRRRWQLARDVEQRGYTAAEVAAAQPARERDAARYIRVQRPLASLLLRFADGPDGISAELFARRAPATAALAPLADFLATLSGPGLALLPDAADPDGLPSDLLQVGAHPDRAAVAALQGWLLAHTPAADTGNLARLGALGGGPLPPRSEPLAIAQLIIAYLLAASR